jgi:U3 small nucleolar RNA-associated protein 6
MLLAAITKAAVKGPGTGGLGAAAAAALMTTWQQQGAEAARQLWKQLLLLPPAGGDMFQVMIQQEVAAAGGSMPAAAAAAEEDATNKHEQQAAASLPADALRRVRALYNAWADAYGAFDADLWVQYALFEQTQSKQGPGKVYWRAVKALLEPDAFIQQYRAVIGLL